MTEREQFALLLGEAGIALWGELPRNVQEGLFEAALRNRPELRYNLARLLHELHPRTHHPPKPA
jgi:hypothetical protein